MKNTLKLFAAAATEMVRTQKARVAFQAAFVGAILTGYFVSRGHADYVGVALECTIGTGLGEALWQTGTIYNRMRKEQKFSSHKNG